MKPLLFGFSGLALALWSMAEATVVLSQMAPIGRDTGVGTMWVFQVGVLIAAILLVLKIGGIARDWSRGISEALKLAAAVESVANTMKTVQTSVEYHTNLLGRHEHRMGEIEADAEGTRERMVALDTDMDVLSGEILKRKSDAEDCREHREALDRRIAHTDDRVLALERRVRHGDAGPEGFIGRAGGAA